MLYIINVIRFSCYNELHNFTFFVFVSLLPFILFYSFFLVENMNF